MKKIFAILVVLATFAFVGCVKQSEFSADSLPVKCIVTGYVTYSGNPIPMGTEVRVFYGIPSGEEVDYAVTTTTINAKGGFRADLGCPVGQSLKVRCEVSYVAVESMSENLYYGASTEKTILSGSADHFKFTVAKKSNLTYPETNKE